MELALPAFPSEPWPQAAFLAVIILVIAGLAMLIFPATTGRLIGLESRETRPGGISEIRPAGGFLFGLAAVTLIFDQPVIYTGLGIALLIAAFARLISLMSDTSASLLNILLLVVQLIFASAALYYFFDVVTPEITFGVPEEMAPKLVFFTYAALALAGFLVLFAPRIAMNIAGLWVTPEKPGGIASVRSTGGFALGAGLMGMGLNNPMLDLALAAAFIMSVAGRILALVINRGNVVFNLAGLVAEAAAATIVATYIASMM